MNKRVSIGALFTLMAIVAAVTFSMTMVFSMSIFNDKVYNLKEREAIYSKLSEIDKIFRTNYAGQIDDKLLMDALSSGYAKGSGDAYAKYYTAEAYKKESQTAEGRIVGIGVVTNKDPSGYLVITDIYPGSTAESSGLKIGDLIIKIDETEVKAENSAQMQELLQGEPGTKIKLVVRRESEDNDLDVTRRYVDIPSVFPKMLEDNVGYLRVSNISDTTDEQFIKQLEKQIDQGARSFIVDFRNNNGGIFNSAVKILDRILPAKPIVTATYKNGKVEQTETTDSKALNMPIVILTNDKTAREAEIIAQVLKDYGKAKTVGTKTMGKGTKQDVIKLTDGSAILLTTAVYKTPESETFNLVGVKPDYEVKLTADEEKNFATLDENTDPQIKKAVEVVQGLLRAAEESAAGESTSSKPASSVSSEK
ncbi:carboxyl-terminal processing protease [Hydrogenoanaerobacterium saccharovorans]|uniref:Carboxyl-terminal processing protease n=1 Tax=Hydrogenoanaerobacterium saccharovorans TaxID=474960 RepID=A0A1H8AAG6_9FIRM|nr:S41 family peptidase [Hydrogenoanaerobacterium saccharovorans]RPF48114.1 carboxyl-terminal processing protease [Hydrogenoanaerobacterium saccharovorans]SEM66557.1 carboxyl-terminal processing protease [Hydrogenoanaerobacterium saccharovorans]